MNQFVPEMLPAKKTLRLINTISLQVCLYFLEDTLLQGASLILLRLFSFSRASMERSLYTRTRYIRIRWYSIQGDDISDDSPISPIEARLWYDYTLSVSLVSSDSSSAILSPVTETRHIITSLYSRFINFVDKLNSSKKSAVRNLFNVVKNDCRSTTGSNIRKIMLKTNRNCVEDININDISNLLYQKTPNGCEWAINIVKEIVEHR